MYANCLFSEEVSSRPLWPDNSISNAFVLPDVISLGIISRVAITRQCNQELDFEVFWGKRRINLCSVLWAVVLDPIMIFHGTWSSSFSFEPQFSYQYNNGARLDYVWVLSILMSCHSIFLKLSALLSLPPRSSEKGVPFSAYLLMPSRQGKKIADGCPGCLCVVLLNTYLQL